jgi:hypothetical protein
MDIADMNLEEYPDQDGMNVWLSKREVEELLGQFEETSKRIATSLAARCGLRSDEVLDIAPENVVDRVSYASEGLSLLKVESSAR